MKNLSRMIALLLAILLVGSNYLNISANSVEPQGNSDTDNRVLNIVTPTDILGEFSYYGMPDGSITIMSYTGTDANVVIPSSVNGCAVTGIAKNVFFGNIYIETVVLPDTIVQIGRSAFESCTNLISVNLPEGIKSIGERAFYGCSKSLSIKVYNESYAQTYAIENGISFEIIDLEQPSVAPTADIPTVTPTVEPSINPSTDPSADPSVEPTDDPANELDETKDKKPVKPTIKKIKSTAKKTVKITLAKKVKNAKSLQVQIAKKKNFKKSKTIKIKRATKVFKVKHRMIKKKAKLYFRVQGVNGKKTKGKYSVAKMYKVKK